MVDNTEQKKVTSTARSGRRSIKSQAVILLLLSVAALVLLNLLGERFYKRIDLTKEKRYTLSATSKELTQQLDDVLSFTIYLDGDLPADYKRLQKSVREMLDEFKVYSGGHIEYEFENILEGKEKKEQQDILIQLARQGITPTPLETEESDETSLRIVLPGAMVYYKDKTYPINFLKGQFSTTTEDVNQSIEMLEYEISSLIRRCVATKTKSLAFLQGHGELADIDVADVKKQLNQYYSIQNVNINLEDTACTNKYGEGLQGSDDSVAVVLVNRIMKDLNDYDGVVVAKPTIPFNDVERFILDQYIMQGGKVLWLVDELIAELDSMEKYGNIMTAGYELNIDDMLFKYGVRLNRNLIQDIKSCNAVPQIVDNGPGRKPSKRLFRWVFYPVFLPDAQHPVVRNLDGIWGQFAGSIDTVGSKRIKKTVLLHSSDMSRIANNPVNLDLRMIRMQVNPAAFNKGNQIAAVLLEGHFESAFKYRKIPEFSILPEVDSNSMIVIADGDIIRNQVSGDRKIYYPLGMDRYTQRTFANAKFVMNCVDYLCDGSGLIEVRNKQIILRLLNTEKVKEEKEKWKLINMIAPVVAVIIFGLLNQLVRRRKYAA